jgi:hypothetical protein
MPNRMGEFDLIMPHNFARFLFDKVISPCREAR